MEFRDGDVVNASGDRVSLGEVAGRSGGEVSADGESAESSGSPWTSFGAHVAEVEVDPDTGVFRLRRYVAVHETGEMLNPIGYHGQIDGGIVYALGQALTEDLVVEQGRVTNPSLADFKLMNVQDIPPLEKIVPFEPFQMVVTTFAPKLIIPASALNEIIPICTSQDLATVAPS